jgi:hypothetical protein
MTYVLLDDQWGDHPSMLKLPRGVRLLYVEGLLYAAKHLTDGHVPTFALRRLTDELDDQGGAAALVEAGLWRATPEGWEIVGYLEELKQSSRADVLRRREESRHRQERSRRHKAGDHSWCTRGRYCPEGQIEPVTRDKQRDGTRDFAPPTPLRSETDPKGGRGEGEEGARSARAPSGSPALRRPKVKVYR